jgi:hypothetical protein
MERYYELKQRYEKYINGRKTKIKKNKELSLKEKRAMIKKIVPRCVNCNKPGGTIFEDKNGMLKAVCASKTPCDLNISIKRIRYDNMRELDIKNEKQSENLKLRIIMTKLDYLFGLNKSKDDIVDKFNTLKNELAALSEKQLILNKNYGDIISGINRDPLLNDATMDLVNETDELKKIYNEYKLDKKTAYLKTMVEKYLTTILPLTEQIRKIKYGYYEVEQNNEVVELISNEGDAETDDKKTSVYTLVANPYRFEQIEQARK